MPLLSFVYNIVSRFKSILTTAFYCKNKKQIKEDKTLLMSDSNTSSHKFVSIEEIQQKTKFSKSELRFIYKEFKQKCPNGILTEKNLTEIFEPLFIFGSCKLYAKHLLSAMLQQQQSKSLQQIDFELFVTNLSIIMRGSLDEKIKWLFNFYDINRDGLVSQSDIDSVINSIYDLIGNEVFPLIDKEARDQHLELAIKKMGLNSNTDDYLSYEQFYQLFQLHVDSIDLMTSVFDDL